MKYDNEVRMYWSEALINQVENRCEEAIKWLTRPVEDGLPQALKLMGDLYMIGLGTEKDSQKGFSLYKQSAEGGYALGQSKLGDCYKYGLGTEENIIAAAEWYSKAADQGDCEAMQELAELLLDGEGIERNEERGIELLKKAADTGNARSQWMLGGLLIDPSTQNITSVEQDISTGVEWIQKSAEQSYGQAEYLLASFYIQGRGVNKDLSKAKELLARALEHGGLIKEVEDDARETLAKLESALACASKTNEDCPGVDENTSEEKQVANVPNGDIKAQYHLGDDLYGDVKFGSGTPEKDKVECRKIYAEALDGRPGAEYEMGNILAEGMYCILVNKKEAFAWYLKSAEHGFADAQYAVARFYLLGEKDVVDCNDEEKFKWYWEAAAQGHVESMRKVGDSFYYGSGVDEDRERAKIWYARAAKAGDDVSLNMLKGHWELDDDELHRFYGIISEIPVGMNCKADDEDKSKFRELIDSAKSGDAVAQFRLGHAFVYGDDGAKMNEHHGVMWLKKSAAQGNADAENLLGDCYGHGWGVGKNAEAAAKHYRSAAENGHGEAAEEIGKWYRRGIGVEKDMAEAFRFYTIAAKAGRDEAQFWVGKFYAEGWGGVAKDYSKAVEWYEKSATQDNSDAICALGWCYQLGNGVEQDYAKAVEWFKKGVDQDDGTCMNNLARLIEEGKGTERDYEVALELFKKATKNDCSRANYHVGRFYENGLGCDKDIDEAKVWYKKAADKGDKDAKAALERLG